MSPSSAAPSCARVTDAPRLTAPVPTSEQLALDDGLVSSTLRSLRSHGCIHGWGRIHAGLDGLLQIRSRGCPASDVWFRAGRRAPKSTSRRPPSTGFLTLSTVCAMESGEGVAPLPDGIRIVSVRAASSVASAVAGSRVRAAASRLGCASRGLPPWRRVDSSRRVAPVPSGEGDGRSPFTTPECRFRRSRCVFHPSKKLLRSASAASQSPCSEEPGGHLVREPP